MEIVNTNDLLQFSSLAEKKPLKINGKEYFLQSPIIFGMEHVAKLIGYMATADMDEKSFNDAVRLMEDKKGLANVVSYAICADQSLADELSKGTIQELQDAIILYRQMTVETTAIIKALAQSIGKIIVEQIKREIKEYGKKQIH